MRWENRWILLGKNGIAVPFLSPHPTWTRLESNTVRRQSSWTMARPTC